MQINHPDFRRKPIAAACRRTIPDIRLRLLASRVHALGERPLYELFRELDGGADLHQTLARLPAEFIAAHSGDRLMPLRVVEGHRE